MVESNLGELLTEDRRYEEARSVLLEALNRLDAFAERHPEVAKIRSYQLEHLRRLAIVSEASGLTGNSLNLTQATQLSFRTSFAPSVGKVGRPSFLPPDPGPPAFFCFRTPDVMNKAASRPAG